MCSDSAIKHPSQRIDVVDALRGFALMGVGLVHMLEKYVGDRPNDALVQIANATILDKIVGGFGMIFLTGKFYLAFSLLFGVSFYLQIRKPLLNGSPYALRFFWRLTILFGFGFIHHLFYRGDILMVYAVLGCALLPLQYVSNKALLIIAALLIAGAGKWVVLLVFNTGLPMEPAGPDGIDDGYLQSIMADDIGSVFQENLWGAFPNLINFQWGIFGRGYVTLGLFLLGLYLSRINFFDQLKDRVSTIKKAIKYAAIFGGINFILTIISFWLVEKPLRFDRFSEGLALVFYDVFNICMTVVIFGIFIIVCLNKRPVFMQWLSPYGRMALSNYLLQTLVGTAIFYAWGFGRIMVWGNTVAFLAGIAIFVFQVYLSKYWMAHYYYGPLEWLWRCLTKWTFLPLKKPVVS